MKRAVAIRNAHPRLRVASPEVEAVIARLDAAAAEFAGGCPPGELSVVFLTDPALAQIHADFLGDPTVTDVITFEGSPAALGSAALAQKAGLAGEICVSADMAARFVGLVEGPAPAGPRPSGSWALQKKFSTELTLYVVHGWLHLAGYDDVQPAKKRRMRAAEKRAMTLLRAAKAVPAFKLT